MLEESEENLLARLDDRLQGMEARMLGALERQQSQRSSNVGAMPRFTNGKLTAPSPSATVPANRREAGIEPYPLPRPGPYNTVCRCACHTPTRFSMVLTRPPILGLVTLTYSTRGHRECSDVECRKTCAAGSRSLAFRDLRIAVGQAQYDIVSLLL
jgi:hypothetical protein